MALRSLSYWESAIGLKSVLVADEAPRRTDVLIVGAGFCGSWLAYFLKSRHPSLDVTIVERDFFSLGASARNAGFLSCGNISEWLEDLVTLGWDETLRTFEARIRGIEIIRSELGDELKVDPCGSVDLDPATVEKASLAAKLNEFLCSRGWNPIFESKPIRVGGSDNQAFVNTYDGAVNPCEILLALHGKLRRAGVRICRGLTVSQIRDGGAVVAAVDGFEHRINYGYGFVCVNAFAGRLNGGTDVQPARGQIIVTSPVTTDTRRSLGFLRAGYDYYRFIGDRVLVGGGRLNFKDVESTDSFETTAELRAYLVDLARRIIGHEEFKVDFHWAGIMGLRAGRHACITEFQAPVSIDLKTEEVSSCGGWGVTLSPYVARRRAESWR